MSDRESYSDYDDPAPIDAHEEIALLREDAERYRWLREQHWDDSVLCVTTHPKQNLRLGAYCPSGELLDAAIDAAIKDKK
tara:strand:- start:194 stop:433 length:240 start_codon:yes stop_codon:yes gene_type:complete